MRAYVLTCITNFHIIIIKNTSTVFSCLPTLGKSKKKNLFFQAGPPRLLYVRVHSTVYRYVRNVSAREKMLPHYFLLCRRVATPSIPRNNNNGRHYWLICAHVSLHSIFFFFFSMHAHAKGSFDKVALIYVPGEEKKTKKPV